MHFEFNSFVPVLSSLMLLSAFVSATIDDTKLDGIDIETSFQLEARADSPTFTSDSHFKNYMLTAHTFYRSQHNVGALTWNTERAAASTTHSRKCAFSHSGANGAGENIALGYSNVPGVVNAWGQERSKYDFSQPGFSSSTGHFTQIVWKDTKTVGCGRTKCSRGWLVVCQYTPPGNYLGTTNFRNNVLSQISGGPADKYNPPPISRVKRVASEA